MTKKPTIAEIEALMDDGANVEILPDGKIKVEHNPTVHVLEDVLRISELEAENKELRVALEAMIVYFSKRPQNRIAWSIINEASALLNVPNDGGSDER